MHRSVEYTRDRKPTKVIAVIEVRYQDLQWSGYIASGSRNGPDDGLERALHFFPPAFYAWRGGPSFGVGVQNRKVEVLFFVIDIDEEVVDLFHNLNQKRTRMNSGAGQ